ncbi:MAG: thiamine phosphate synthase [Patescibacteria group bacterium]|nr:thiamine phosphate synthase [Patescibacteria group bacterium]
MNIDYSLYLVTDKNLAGKKSVLSIVALAIEGGVTIVQYREKNASTRLMIEEGRALHKITTKAGIPLIIDDRIDVALAIDAEGVHVGQSDMPANIVRQIIGQEKILGVTASNVVEAKKAVKDGADYLGVSDIFGSTTKTDTGKPVGIGMLKKIKKVVKIPIVGIGGVTLENANQVIRARADGIAVISAVFLVNEPKLAAEKLKKIVSEAKS